jgi:UDP-glucose:(heptosyl)LPS alpha-1,3-glucosyltransferase
MKVAISFPACHRRGGIERIVLETANFLAGRGHDVHLCACRWDGQLLDPKVKVHAVAPGHGPAPLPAIAFARRSRKCVAQIGADVTAAFGVYCPTGGVFWAGSVHRAWMEASRGHRDLWGRLRQRLNPFHPVMLAFERHMVGGRRFKTLIAYTPRVKADFMRWYGVPDDLITVIPSGYSTSEFNLEQRVKLREPTRTRLGYSPQDKVVLFVANELHRKGFGPLIRAMAAGKPSEKLLAVGRFSPAGFQAEIRSLGITDRVQFAGSTDNIAEFYAAADVFALPTQYEPWGLVIVEALACGLPVLTSHLAGAAVAVKEGKTGLLLDQPSDEAEIAAKLRRLLDGEHADAQTISRSVAHLTWPSVLGDYEQVLLQCSHGQ